MVAFLVFYMDFISEKLPYGIIFYHRYSKKKKKKCSFLGVLYLIRKYVLNKFSKIFTYTYIF